MINTLVVHYVVLAITSSLLWATFILIHKNVKLKYFRLIFGVNTSKKWERITALCLELNTWACRGIPQANILSECLMSERRKSGVFFAVRVGFKVSSFGNFTVLERTWSNHNIVTYKFQYLWRVWTSPTQGRESYLPQWACVFRVILAQNHIEFEWGSKLSGTSSEASVNTSGLRWPERFWEMSAVRYVRRKFIRNWTRVV